MPCIRQSHCCTYFSFPRTQDPGPRNRILWAGGGYVTGLEVKAGVVGKAFNSPYEKFHPRDVLTNSECNDKHLSPRTGEVETCESLELIVHPL